MKMSYSAITLSCARELEITMEEAQSLDNHSQIPQTQKDIS